MCHYTCYAFRSYLAWGSSLQVDSQPHDFCSSSIFKRIPEMASSASLELGIMILSQVSCWVPLVLGVALGVMSDVSYVFKYHVMSQSWEAICMSKNTLVVLEQSTTDLASLSFQLVYQWPLPQLSAQTPPGWLLYHDNALQFILVPRNSRLLLKASYWCSFSALLFVCCSMYIHSTNPLDVNPTKLSSFKFDLANIVLHVCLCTALFCM